MTPTTFSHSCLLDKYMTQQQQQQHFEDDELVVNYEDACIYGRDLKLLEEVDCDTKNASWLNDACLHFQFMRLQHRQKTRPSVLRSSGTSSFGTDLFWDPSVVSFFVHQCQLHDTDELRDLALGYNNFKGINRIFVPINDNFLASSSWQTPGMGSHWSLLIFLCNDSASSKQFLHFDSVPGSNTRAARSVALKFIDMWTRMGRLYGPIPNRSVHTVQECHVPKQRNAFDCGVHVLATAEAVLGLNDDDDDTKELYEQAIQQHVGLPLRENPNFCVELRQRIARDIRAGAQESSSSIE
jgi:Ulp1 family protease